MEPTGKRRKGKRAEGKRWAGKMGSFCRGGNRRDAETRGRSEMERRAGLELDLDDTKMTIGFVL
jgi:hypothetical protein